MLGLHNDALRAIRQSGAHDMKSSAQQGPLTSPAQHLAGTEVPAPHGAQ